MLTRTPARRSRPLHFRCAAGSSVLATAVLLSACSGDPVGPTSDGMDRMDEPLITAAFEEQVAGDATVAEAMVEDAALWVSADHSIGPWAEARDLFRQARHAWRLGDTEEAAQLAHRGRLLLAQELIDRRGSEGLAALEGHVEGLLERLAEASEEYARAEELADRLSELLEDARARRAEGELVGAAERLILAMGIADRMRHRLADGPMAEAIAKRAVATAEAIHERVLVAVGPNAGPRVEHALAHSGELLRRANVALEREGWRRAVVLARRSIGWALHGLRLHRV